MFCEAFIPKQLPEANSYVSPYLRIDNDFRRFTPSREVLREEITTINFAHKLLNGAFTFEDTEEYLNLAHIVLWSTDFFYRHQQWWAPTRFSRRKLHPEEKLSSLLIFKDNKLRRQAVTLMSLLEGKR